MAASVANKADSQNLIRYGLEEIFTHNLAQKCRSLKNTIIQAGFKDPEFIFVKDNRSVRKLSLYPAYKSNRKSSGELDPLFAEGIQFLKSNGYGEVCQSLENEADDAIATLTNQLGGIIVSNDKDMWQCLEKNKTWILNPRTHFFITVTDIRKAFKLEDPRHVALFKTIWGDGGDAVPNVVPRMQKQLLPVVRKSDGTLDDFLKLVLEDKTLNERCRYLLAKAEEQLRINYQLVKLDTECRIIWDE